MHAHPTQSLRISITIATSTGGIICLICRNLTVRMPNRTLVVFVVKRVVVQGLYCYDAHCPFSSSVITPDERAISAIWSLPCLRWLQLRQGRPGVPCHWRPSSAQCSMLVLAASSLVMLDNGVWKMEGAYKAGHTLVWCTSTGRITYIG